MSARKQNPAYIFGAAAIMLVGGGVIDYLIITKNPSSDKGQCKTTIEQNIPGKEAEARRYSPTLP